MAKVSVKPFIFILFSLLLLLSGVFYGQPDIVSAGTETYNHIIPFTITDTSGGARTNVPVVIEKDIEGQLIAYGLVNSTVTDTYVDSTNGETNNPVGSGTAYEFLPSDDYLLVNIPSLPAYGSVTINLYTGYSPSQTAFPIITGDGGYVRVSRSGNLEFGDDFTLSISTRIDTDNGTGKKIFHKINSSCLYISPTTSENVTFEAFGGSNQTSTVSEGDTAEGAYVNLGIDATLVDMIGFRGYNPNATNPQLRLHVFQIYNSDNDSWINPTSSNASWTNNANALDGNTGTYAYDVANTDWTQWYTAFFNPPVRSNQIRWYTSDPDSDYTTKQVKVGGIGGKTLVATGVSSGEATITITSVPGANITLSIDGVAQDTTALSGFSVVNNTNDYVMLSSNVTSYTDNVSITINGTEQMRLSPSAKIVNSASGLTGTIPDSASDGTSNSGNLTYGSNSGMTITGKSIMDSNSATSVGATSVLMNSDVMDLGTWAAAYGSFEYGLDTDYGYFTSETAITTNTTNAVTLTGLTPNTTYHYRAVLRNGVVYSYGEDIDFTTALSSASEGSTTPLIQDVGVFQDYQSTGDMLVVAEIILTYPPYYPTEVSYKYFQMQLLDTDGSTVLAAVPISQWGDRPTAIYLNPTVVSNNITYGEDYTVRISNVSTENISVSTSETITDTDWRGNNLEELDSWCIGVATSMQNFDGTILTDPYTQSDPAYGIIITNTAGGYFVKGIPNIATVRPNLFTTSKYNEVAPGLTSTISYKSGNTTLAAGVGNTIATDMTTVGTVFDLTNQEIMVFMIFGVMIGSSIYTVSETRGFGSIGAIALTLPLFGSAMYLNITEIQMLAIFGVIAAFIFVWKFVLSRL